MERFRNYVGHSKVDACFRCIGLFLVYNPHDRRNILRCLRVLPNFRDQIVGGIQGEFRADKNDSIRLVCASQLEIVQCLSQPTADNDIGTDTHV